MTDFKFESWPTEFRTINQYFGANPQNYARFGLPGHTGIDFMARDGTKVICVAPGTVFATHPEPTGHNYGTHVRVNHSDSYQTTYAHLRQLFVSVGQTVQAGDVLGLADSTGNSVGSHLHLTLKKLDANCLNWPLDLTDPTPFVLPLLGFQTPAGSYVDGWASTTGVTLGPGLAEVNSGGNNLRTDASMNAYVIALVPASTIMIVTGDARNDYLPVKVARAAVGLPDAGPLPTPPPPVAQPDPFPAASPPPPPPTPSSPNTTPGLAFTTQMTITGQTAVAGQYGPRLRNAARRDATEAGCIPGGTTIAVTRAAQCEYASASVDNNKLQPLFGTAPATPGAPAVPSAVSARALSQRRGVTFAAEDVLLTNGAFAALAVALNAVTDPGDEVIFVSPPWFFYESLIVAAGAVPVRVKTTPGTFDLDLEAIAAAVKARTRAIIVNSLNNPTGLICPPETLAGLGRLLTEAGARNGRAITRLSDEAYSRIVCEGQPFYSPTAYYPNSLLLYTYGKTPLTPCQRLGYVSLPPDLLDREHLRGAMFVAQPMNGYAFPNALLQHAPPELEEACVDIAHLQRKRDWMVSAPRQMGYELRMPQGNFLLAAALAGGGRLGIRRAPGREEHLCAAGHHRRAARLFPCRADRQRRDDRASPVRFRGSAGRSAAGRARLTGGR